MFNGIINKMWTKSVATKYGEKPVTLFSLDTSDESFNLGFGKQSVQEGDEVSFNAAPKYGEQSVDKGTLQIVSRGNTPNADAPKPAPAAPSAPKNTGGGKSGYSRGNFPLEFNDGQRSILRQHAFTQASEVYRAHYPDAMQCHDIEPDESVNQIIQLAYMIEKYTSGDDIREEMKEE